MIRVGLIFLQHEILIRYIFRKHERTVRQACLRVLVPPAVHRIRILRAGRRVYGQTQQVQEIDAWLFQPEYKGVVIRRIHAQGIHGRFLIIDLFRIFNGEEIDRIPAP